MKKIIFALMGLAMLSCESGLSITEPDGLQGDTIKTSVDAVTLTDDKPSVEITTDGKDWLFSEFEVDGRTYPLPQGYAEEIPQDIDFDLPEGYTIELSAIEGYQLPYAYMTVTTISCDWVTITRTLQSITVTATATETDKPLSLKLRLQDRNYTELITITRE